MFGHNSLRALSIITLFLKLNRAEWVDMPQFSDENKIYRVPSTQFYKFKGDDTNNFSDDQRNGNQTFRLVKATNTVDDKITDIEKAHPASELTTASYLFPNRIADNFAESIKNRTPTGSGVVTEDKLSGGHDTTIPPTTDTAFKMFTTQPSPTSTTHREDTSQDEYYNRTMKSNDGILQYLPVDILKSVHRTLQSQPASFEGKIHFLKTFEKTLMSEIESRLTTTMTPSRKTRGADHHSYYDHDDHTVGFPSIEGALMAISFLTFAVYLVRLVMLLFRNMNNPMTTTTAATLFLGKRKRSADLDDDTVRILNNMNSFVPNF